MQNTEVILKEINDLNTKAWINRFELPELSRQFAEQALKISTENNFIQETKISSLNIIITKIIQSEYTQSTLKELLKIVDFFENITPNQNYVNALKYTSELYEKLGDFEKALKFCEKAIQLASKLNLMQPLADAFSLYSDLYSRLSDWQTALSYQQKAFKIRKKLKDNKATASSMNLIARIYSFSGNYKSALEKYNETLDYRTKINDIEGLMWTHIGLASTFHKLNNPTKTEYHYSKSLKINEHFKDKRATLYCYFGIGKMKLEKNNKKNAEIYLLKALNLAKQINNKLLVFDIYEALSETYEKLNLYDKSLKYYKLYHKTKESVVNTDLQNKLKNQLINFEVERSKREAEISHLKNVKLKNVLATVEEKNLQITDSIKYAQKIQFALINPMNILKNHLKDYFVLFMPRDIVSGDFYWLNVVNNLIFIVAADCTGHGVPGAFMSILGISFLNDIIVTQNFTETDKILNLLRDKVKLALRQDDTNTHDGMDISLCVIDKNKKTLQYSGAYNPLIMIRNSELSVIKGDRMPVGKYIIDDKPFTKNNIEYLPNDQFYIYSDGYTDQFSDSNFEKFKLIRLKKIFSEIHNKPSIEQKNILKTIFVNWKGNNVQIDDVLVIGFSIS
ncbi:MAG: tetratricopeptide repeat protein [Bacteroidales bacterium]|nr:tetratricopeptide repeat protein [Bacteroidales bacterium]